MAVAAGGAIGAPARYAIEFAHPARVGGFPFATFAINVSGALTLGFFLVMVVEGTPRALYLRPFVATGILGAFTTFSTLAVEIVVLAKDGHVPMAVVYAATSIAVGLVAARTGLSIGRRVTRRAPARP